MRLANRSNVVSVPAAEDVTRRDWGDDVTRRKMRRKRGPALRAGVITALAALALLAAACGSSASAPASAHVSSNPSSASVSTRPTTPSASGTVAAITATSMEVQNPQTGQVTVGWTSSTVFTQTETASLAAVVPGACVMVVGARPASGGSTGPITASSLTIFQPGAGGSCAPGATGAGAAGIGFPAGGGFQGAGRTPPGRFAGGGTTGRGGRLHGRFPGRFELITGKVISASAGSISVEGSIRSGRHIGRQTTGASAASTVIKVLTSATTVYQQVAPASSSDLAVGKCVLARGPASQTGSISAVAVSIRSPGPSGCVTSPGAGRFPGGGSPGGGVGGGGGGSAPSAGLG